MKRIVFVLFTFCLFMGSFSLFASESSNQIEENNDMKIFYKTKKLYKEIEKEAYKKFPKEKQIIDRMNYILEALKEKKEITEKEKNEIMKNFRKNFDEERIENLKEKIDRAIEESDDKIREIFREYRR